MEKIGASSCALALLYSPLILNTPYEPKYQGSKRPELHIVGIGDSITAGAGTASDPDISNPCDRGEGSYVFQLAAQLGTENIQNVACTGATTEDLLVPDSDGRTQLDALSPETDVVTLTIGANDEVSMGNTVHVCQQDGCAPGSVYYEEVKQRLEGPSFTDKLTQVYGEVLRRAPHAEVVVVGYPNPFANPIDHAVATLRVGNGSVDMAAMITKEVNAASSRAVDAYRETGRISLVTPTDMSLSQFFTDGRDPRAQLHPNEAGHRHIANSISREIGKKVTADTTLIAYTRKS